ncbi:MAG: hypothetical protein AB7I27_06895 [Bacteriovoracaceae bacterium]
MKKLALFIFLLISQLTLASSLEGTYRVINGCNANFNRIPALMLLIDEGSEVQIKLDQANASLVFSSYHEDPAIMPTTSESNLPSPNSKKYYKNAKVSLTDSTYLFMTSGSELNMCSNYPFPGSRPCLSRWDDVLSLKISGSKLSVEWQFQEKKGSCLLEKK